MAVTQQLKDLINEVPTGPSRRALQSVLQTYLDDLPSFELFVEELIENGGDFNSMLHRTHEPVTIEQFLEDDYFAGMQGDDILWPEVRKAVCEVINGGYYEMLCGGGIGTGKTTGAHLVNAYSIYDLSTYISPQFQLDLMLTSSIVFVMLNRTDTLAKQVTYGEFRALIEAMPYFKEQFPLDSKVQSIMEFPKRIRVEYSAASTLNLLGKNVLGGVIDEMNFMARVEQSKQSFDGGMYDQAKSTYRTMVRRRKSRFNQQGVVPGVLCVVSSKAYHDDFIEEREREVLAEKSTHTYIYHKAQWEALPAHRFKGINFLLEVGDDQHTSKILQSRDDGRKGARVLEVPIEYIEDFERDMEGSMQDVAGISVFSTRPYFYDRERVWEIANVWDDRDYVRIFDVDETDFSGGLPTIRSEYKVVDPHKQRACHIDLAVTKDSCGIAVGRVDEVIVMSNKPGVIEVERVEAPVVVYDLLLTIHPPKGGEIEFSMIRNLIYLLSDAGLPIKYITYDGFQSVDSRQILKRRGYKTKQVSVEGVEAYEALRTAIWQERVIAPRHSLCFSELCALEEDTKLKRIDHVLMNSKDTSDSMAGVYKMLALLRSSWRMDMQKPKEEAKKDDTPSFKIVPPRPTMPKRRSIIRR